MAVAFRSSTSTTGSKAGQAFSINKPAGVVQNDLLIAFVSMSPTGSWTGPAGWTELIDINITDSAMGIYYKVAGAAEGASYTFTDSVSGAKVGTILAYTGVNTTTPIDASGFTSSTIGVTNHTAPSLTATTPGVLLTAFFGNAATTWTPPTGMTERHDLLSDQGAGYRHSSSVAELVLGSAGATGEKTGVAAVALTGLGIAVVLTSANNPPNAPTLVSPVGNVTIDRTSTQRFSWTFSDPDTGDTQSKYDLQYRVGTGAWTVVTGVTPSQFHDFAASTFAANPYEWQVRTYDAQGLVGPYSASGFFTAATPPVGPTITAPTNNSTVSSSSTTLTWSFPTEQAYQVRVLDAADAVVSDTGIVENAATRSVVVSLPTNNVTRKLQVRVRDAGLWSPYSTVTVTVSFTPPAAPTLTATPVTATGSINVAIIQPALNLLSAAASSFEDGTTGGWSPNGLTIASTTTQAFSGSRSLSTTWNGTGTIGPRLSFSGLASNTYTYSAYVRIPTGHPDLFLLVNTTDAGSGSSALVTTRDAWVRVVVTKTGTPSFMDWRPSTTPANGAVFHFDAVKMEQNSTASAYTDPGSPSATSADLFRREGSSGNGIRIAAGLIPAATFIDRSVASNVLYEYKVRAIAANSTTADSAWTP